MYTFPIGSSKKNSAGSSRSVFVKYVRDIKVQQRSSNVSVRRSFHAILSVGHGRTHDIHVPQTCAHKKREMSGCITGKSVPSFSGAAAWILGTIYSGKHTISPISCTQIHLIGFFTSFGAPFHRATTWSMESMMIQPAQDSPAARITISLRTSVRFADWRIGTQL